MRNRILAAFGILFSIVIVLSCVYIVQQLPNDTKGSSATAYSAAQIQMPADFTGTWKTKKGVTPNISAKIAGGMIDIQMVDGDNSLTFWNGTLDNPTDKDPHITSVGRGIGDPNGKPYWSTEKQMEFTYEGGQLTFAFSAVGVSTKVAMERA